MFLHLTLPPAIWLIVLYTFGISGSFLLGVGSLRLFPDRLLPRLPFLCAANLGIWATFTTCVVVVTSWYPPRASWGETSLVVGCLIFAAQVVGCLLDTRKIARGGSLQQLEPVNDALAKKNEADDGLS